MAHLTNFISQRSYKKNLKEEYYVPLGSHKSELLGETLENAWKIEFTRTNPSLWNALWKVFHLEFMALGLLFIFSEFTLKLSQPWLIGKLMNNDNNGTSIAYDNSYFYGGLIVLTNFLSVIVGHFYQLKVQHLGMKIRVACCSLIYRKVLKINKKVAAESDVGKMINMISNDVNRFDLAAMYMLQLIVGPIETVFVIFCLYSTIGPTSVTGIVFLVLFIPCQMYMGKLTTSYRKRTATKTDRRIKLMNEIISGIQVIKMLTWEKLFDGIVSEARRLELDQILKVSRIRALNVSFMLFMNRTGIFLCILTYVLTGNELNAKYVFVVSSFYAILRQALTVYFPFGIQNFSETKVSVERIRNFLLIDEADREITTYVPTQNGSLIQNDLIIYENKDKSHFLGVDLEEVSVKWLQSSKEYVLHNINFKAYSNELAVIIGPVGSGKSTLLYTILKELPLSRGKLNVNGIVSYASQEPWLFSGTLRQNILFGSKFDMYKYKKVVRVCQLEDDFSALPNSDGTSVGENGASLSGGQKSRINLARAIYKDADIYLLDDPLSAVDVKVGKKIFEQCIGGYLKDKCTILVTHQVNFLQRSTDRIYELNEGIITNNLTYIKTDQSENETEFASAHIGNYNKQKVEGEETRQGLISKGVYKTYGKAGGGCFIRISLCLLFILAQTSASGADYFIAFWVNRVENNEAVHIFDNKVCVSMYAFIIFVTIIMSITRSLTFFKYCLNASATLHDAMFSKIIGAATTFFKTASSGRILNRFSKDVGMIDETLPSILMDTCQVIFIVLGSAVLILILNPWMMFPTAIIFTLFYYFKTIFIARSRNLKRFEAAARSPIYSHMSTTLQGLATIRTYGSATTTLQWEFDHFQDLHSSAFYMFLTCNRAFGFWLDMNCVFYTAAVIMTLTLNHTPAGNVGLGITQSINLIGVLQWGIRQWSELENQMINVERVMEYTKVLQETSSSDNSKNLDSWPNNGEIVFKSVFLQYSDRLALNDVSFVVKSKEKIGIVGRTGAGKSSLISCLFRLFESKGEIYIDGMDITQIPLKTLRSKISIIPQEPILFTGSLRDNLDPFHEYADHILWNVLEQVELKNTVLNLSKGLYTEILGRGSNMSVGQRQLICLARAILRNNKILILDEATSSIDFQTDCSIQNSIKKNFRDCTMLTVAHRLSTIMESDKVLVMDDGKIVEFDRVDNLLKNSDSLFSELVTENGKENTKLYEEIS